jgi:Ser/Thr protein kinase RdoA (MazF antagonist)
MTDERTETLADFTALTPDMVINQAERALGKRLTSLCRPMNSYINRVFELETDDREGIIAKFYRPGRWKREALQDEHDYVLELAEREIPVIPPLELTDGSTLGDCRGIHFALFQKKSGRSCDEPSDEQWEELGRLMARVHAVGALHPAKHRITMSPRRSTVDNIEFILRSGTLPRELRGEYERAARDVVARVAPMFEGIEMIRIHGDCHRGNIIYRPDESFYLIDFDDMAMGPPVQDFWMLLPDYSRASLLEIDLFLEGYNTFRDFDHRTLKLIEPLRAMRYIHYAAWCAAQAAGGAVTRLGPGWGTQSYWRGEINDLRRQQDEIDATATGSNPQIRDDDF